MLVALAQKPLTVCELQAALAVDVKVTGELGLPRMFASALEKVCLPLVRACPTKKTMKMIHHSVRDFLLKELPTPEDWDIAGVEDFFIDEAKGSNMMTLICLSYMSGPSESQIDVRSLPYEIAWEVATMGIACDNESNKENDFMKYAAIYWHAHADSAEVTPVLVKALLSFLRSPGFIACLRIRSRHAPYHFSTFISCDNSALVAFADTMPGWLESTELVLGSEGKEIAFQYYSFVKEWGHVLVRYPGEIERCLIGTLGNIFFSPVEATKDVHFLDGRKRVHYLDLNTSNFTSVSNLQGEAWVFQLKLRS